MQKLDKIAIIAVAVILLLGFVASFLGADPGKALTEEIDGYAQKIEETADEQSDLRPSKPTDFGAEVEDLFDVADTRNFPQWTFYRRPTYYSVEKVPVKVEPEHSNGGICKVEVVREEAGKRLLHRVTGVGASCNDVVTIGRQALEVAPLGDDGIGSWTEVAPIPWSENRESFTIDIDSGLEQGTNYVYRVVSTATTDSEIQFSTGASQTLESAMDGSILYPENVAWECTRAVPTGPAGPGSASITRHRWDWKRARVVRDPNPNAIEGDRTPIFPDEPYWVDQIRGDKSPIEVRLRGPERSQRMTLEVGVDPQALDPDPWEATDGPCFETDADESADAGDTGGAGAGAADPEPVDDDDDGGGGGLFGDD